MIHVEHMQGYAELKDKVEIVAAVDRKRECLEAVRDKWGLPENAAFCGLGYHACGGAPGCRRSLFAEL